MNNKKVAIDARMIGMSGIGTYIQNLMSAGIYDIALGRADEIKKYSNVSEIIDYDVKIYGIKEQLKFPYRSLKKMKPDILHIPHYNVPIFYRGRMFVTIHDLTHLVLPEILPNKFAYIYAWVMLWIACHKAEKIFTVSENTKKDILRYYKIDPNKIVVTYNGVNSERFRKKELDEYSYLYEKYSIPKNKKILMYVGNLKPHKNLKRLLEAFSQIEQKENSILILVGKAFDTHDVSEYEDEYRIRDKVIHTGMVSDEELVDFYNLADIFVFPSLYEGFGLPPLEAMACGTPVACSNSSSLPEVVGDAAVMFDATNVDDIKNKINLLLILFDKNDIKKYVENGYKQYNHFKWSKSIDLFRKEI